MELRVGTSVVGPGGQRYRVAQIKKAFNPNQPRDEEGQWTSGGAYPSRVSDVTRALKERGYRVVLRRGRGYFYFEGPDIESAYTTSVLVNRLDALSTAEWVAEFEQLAGVEKAFNPNQPRDERGRWSAGGGLGGSIRQHLEMRQKFFGGQGFQIAGSPDSFILEHGRGFPTDADTYVGGTPHECFKNSTLAVLSNDDLTYVEGYIDVHGVPIHHARTVNKAGVVRDYTLKDGRGIRGYFGVPIQRDYMMQAQLKAKVYGVLTHNQAKRLAAADPAKVVAR